MAQRDQPQYAPRTTDTKKSVCATSLVAQGAAVVAEATLIPSIGGFGIFGKNFRTGLAGPPYGWAYWPRPKVLVRFLFIQIDKF